MRLAYFDCFSGISGDMALGALIQAGADLDEIVNVVAQLPLGGVSIDAEEVEVHGVSATRIQVLSPPQGVIRTYAAIRMLLDDAPLADEPRRTAHRIYHLLARGVGAIHGKDPDLVTFQEFGEVDCIVDIVGCSLALHMLGVRRVFSSPIPTGLGMVRTEHGMMPIPSPIVVELLRGVPTYSRGIPAELVTPTGAAILAAVSEGYGDMPVMTAERVGYGAGHLRLDFPHAVRVVIGEEQRTGVAGTDFTGDVLVEATMEELDDAGAERLVETLFHAGASDAWITPVVGREGLRRSNASAVVPIGLAEPVARVLRSAPGAGEVRRTALLPPG